MSLRSLFGLHSMTLALAALLPTAAAAQSSRPAKKPQGRWWDTPAARTEAARVLAAVPPLIHGTERGDGTRALVLLRDASWILRRLSVIRLKAMGMVGAAIAKLEQRGVPGGTPPPLTDPSYQAAKQFVAGLQVEARSPPQIDLGEASRIVSGIVDVQLRSGSEPPATKLRMVCGLLAYRACLRRAKDRAWLAGTVLDLTDEARILADLGYTKKTRDKALSKGGRRVYRWLQANVDYLYWQPHERRFRLDRAARSAGTPTAKYREQHPWKRGEGPHRRGAKRRQQ